MPVPAPFANSQELQLPPNDYAAMAAALNAVPGVADARIEPSQNGTPGMLHLALEDGSDETVVAGRVAELLRSVFGIGFDTNHAELTEEAPPAPEARPAPEAPPAPTAPTAPPAPEPPAGEARAAPPRRPEARKDARLVIERLRVRTAGLEVRCAVTLSGAGREATGEAGGAANTGGTLRAVAGATLRAIEELTGAAVRLDVEQVQLTSTGQDSTVLVALTMLTATGTTRLMGAAEVRQDLRQAAVRATLDALNRRMGPLLAGGDSGDGSGSAG